MKRFIQFILQRTLGFGNYLVLFSIITVKSIKRNPAERDFLYFIDLIPDEGIILDIGANIGITTVPIAKKKRNATIYSFEPVPENLKALKRVIEYFRLTNVRVIHTALGDQHGELKMIMPIIDKVKMQGLSYIPSDNMEVGTNDIEIIVPVQKLDDIPEIANAQKISAIKIDVENFEYFVLKGASNVLIQHMPIIYCELWDNDKRLLTIDYLNSLGYEVKVYDGGALKNFEGQNKINFFFIPKGVNL